VKTVVKVGERTHSVYWPEGMSPAAALTEAVRVAEIMHSRVGEFLPHAGAWCYPAEVPRDCGWHLEPEEEKRKQT